MLQVSLFAQRETNTWKLPPGIVLSFHCGRKYRTSIIGRLIFVRGNEPRDEHVIRLERKWAIHAAVMVGKGQAGAPMPVTVNRGPALGRVR